MASTHVKQMRDALDRCVKARRNGLPQAAKKAFDEAVAASTCVSHYGAGHLSKDELETYLEQLQRMETEERKL